MSTYNHLRNILFSKHTYPNSLEYTEAKKQITLYTGPLWYFADLLYKILWKELELTATIKKINLHIIGIDNI